MMPPVRKLPPVNLVRHLHRAASAHAAVRAGVATHVQKETARRESALNAARVNAAIAHGVEASSGTLQSRAAVF